MYTFIFRDDFKNFKSHFIQIGTRCEFPFGTEVPISVQGVPVAYFIELGGGKYSILNESGHEEILFHISSNEIYTLSLLSSSFRVIDNTRFVASRESEPMVCYRFPASLLTAYFFSNPTFCRATTEYLLKISNTLISRTLYNSYQNATFRVCLVLYTWLKDSINGKQRYVLKSQEEIASWCGITRVHLSHVLKALESEGIIKISRKTIEVPDPEALLRHCHNLEAEI